MSITDLIICPDCGGIVGAANVSDQGKPCICFGSKLAGGLTPADAATERKKVCCKCGKDLAGRKRLRDSMGYWCYDCHKADEKKRHPEGVACAECGRRVSDSALIDYEGIRICSKCKADHVLVLKQKMKYRSNVAGSAHEALDRKRLFMLMAVMGLLLTIIILSRMQMFHRFL